MHKHTRSIRGPGALLAVGTALLALALVGAPPAFGQVLDGNGYITTGNWLALGPFAQPFGCSGNNLSIICNHIAPSKIYCQYPEVDDEIAYDTAQACSTGYSGPAGATGKPVWRVFDDTGPDCLQNLDSDTADPVVDTDDVVTFLATYFEYEGADPIDVEFCGNSDDGMQLWLDDDLIINDNACRAWGDCAANVCNDLVTVTVTPGVHRIMAGAWERAGGWGVSVGLRVAGAPVVEGGDFVFYGIDKPVGSYPDCVDAYFPLRTVTDLADANVCPPGAQGPLQVTVKLADGTATETVTVIETITGDVVPGDVTADNGGTVAAAAGGVTIQWSVQRSVLQGAAGVSYTANVNLGTFNFSGSVAGDLTVGVLSTTLIAAGDDLGEFDMAGGPEDDLKHGHEIGMDCAGTDITQPGGPGTIAITGAGADIWGTADQFVYAYSAVTGDFTVTVDVTAHAMGNNEWAKHGIMVRENCSPGSRYFYDCDQHADEALATCDKAANANCYIANPPNMQYRDNPNVDAEYPGSPLPANSHTGRLKVERIGGLFIGYAYNIDEITGAEIVAGGPEWIELGRQDWNTTGPPAPADVQVGLAVTSHDGCNLVTVTFENYDVELGTPPQAPTGAVCNGNAQGGVDMTWTLVGRAAGSQKISVNGAEVATLPGTDTSYTVGAASLVDGVNRVCVANDLGGTCCGYFKGNELYINCGGPELGPNGLIDLGDGRTWEEDSTANPTPFLKSGNLNTADFAAGLVTPDQWIDMELRLVDPEFTDDPTRSYLFSTERWADSDVIYRIPLPQGTYDVTLLFAEGCCSEGCQDIPDPQLSAGGCRVFDIIVNGNLVADQFSQHVEAQKALFDIDPTTPPLPNDTWVAGTTRKSVALAKGPYRVQDTTAIEIVLDDLGNTNPPENSSIKGIAIVRSGAVENCDNGNVDDDGDQLADCADPDCASAPNCVGGKKFHRADPNNDGACNITDGIYILNFLFLGGPPPTCRESADANNDGGINITDGIFVLNYLFLGGDTPPAPVPPGKGDCGTDTDPPGGPKDLGCAVYDKCPAP